MTSVIHLVSLMPMALWMAPILLLLLLALARWIKVREERS